MPSRGRYDRHQSKAERWAEHRNQLIHAAADCFAAGEKLTVDSVRARAVAGRNTIYAHFPDLDQLLRAVQSAAVALVSRRVSLALDAANTPNEALRGLVRAWLDAVDEEPALVFALVSDPSRIDELIEEQVRRGLAPALRERLISQVLEDTRIAAVGGALGACVRRYLRRRIGKEDLIAVMVDVFLRAFR